MKGATPVVCTKIKIDPKRIKITTNGIKKYIFAFHKNLKRSLISVPRKNTDLKILIFKLYDVLF
ncbi:MAG: hypothetical protein AUK12_00400 [Candidatus Levybacteria bacterium CG2_30_37_29]|nr:MAG: hypothetical protein AUK12_00400 [Candidatus Levybacteria bacterium CG2_30_37_29]